MSGQDAPAGSGGAAVQPGAAEMAVLDVQERDKAKSFSNRMAELEGGGTQWLNKASSALDILRPEKAVRIEDLATWPEEKRQRFISEFPIEELPTWIDSQRTASWVEAPNTITFRNLYWERAGTLLLNGVSGYLRPGQVVGIIGDTATPLFEVLAARAKGGEFSGEILINGRPRDARFKQQVAYLTKDDVHLPTLTVRETLLFSARMRTPPNQPPDVVKQMRVDLVLKILGLSHVSNSIVGDGTLRGISGGEKRRLSIAAEMVAGHSTLLMDLPTNGLDSATALDFVKKTKIAARSGMSIMMSVVQASPELVEQFDALMIVSRGASVYFGPPSEAWDYFEEIGFRKPREKNVPDFLEEVARNPQKYYLPKLPRNLSESMSRDDVEHALALALAEEKQVAMEKAEDAAARAAAATEDEKAVRGNGKTGASSPHIDEVIDGPRATSKLQDEISRTTKREAWTEMFNAYKNSESYRKLGETLWHELTPKFELRENVKPVPRYATSFVMQLGQLCERQIKVTWRNRPVTWGNLARSVVIALILGSLFYDLQSSEEDARARMGLLFFFLAYAAFSPSDMVPLVMQQRAVYYKQAAAGYFHRIAYYVSVMAGLLPFAATELFILTLVAYPMTNLNDGIFSGRFWFFFFTLLISNIAGRSLVLMTCSFAPSGQVAQAMTPTFMVIAALFAGFFTPGDAIPIGWQWMYTLSYFHYPLRALALNEAHSIDSFRCALDSSGCLINSGRGLLRFYGMDSNDEDTKWEMLLYLFIVLICFNVVAIFFSYVIDFSGAELVKYRADDDGNVAEDTWATALLVNKKAALKPNAAYIEFDDLTYTILTKDNTGKVVERNLLDKVYGYVPPGKLVALMGATGAGKSTLLDVLSGRKTAGKMSGKLLINGKERDAYFSRTVGYVEQFDSHDPTSTVREAVMFSADLRLPPSMSAEEKAKRVDRVLEQLDLTQYANERIGNQEAGGVPPDVSKKVSIAVELVSDVGLLFLDEPTTGLPAAAAVEVMKAVRKLADEVSVICTIHQPSQEIVSKFDWLLLLQPGGQVVYFGPVSEVTQYFEETGLGKYQPGTNVAEFAIDVIHRIKEMKAAGSDRESPHVTFLNHPRGREVKAALAKGIAPSDREVVKFDSIYAADFVFQVRTVFRRFLASNVRDPDYIGGRIFSNVFVALIVGTLFYQMVPDQKGLLSRGGLLFLIVLNTFFSSQAMIPINIKARETYFREVSSNMYSALSYYLARTLADLPFVALQTFLFCTIIYWFSGLTDDNHGAHYGLLLSAMFFVTGMGYGFGEFCASIAPNMELATGIFTVVAIIQMLFTGFLILPDAIPVGWRFLYYFNLFRYPLNYLFINELKSQPYFCSPGEAIPTGNPGEFSCQFQSGDRYLEFIGINPSDGDLFFGLTVLFFGFVRVLGYLSLRYVNYVKR